MKLTTKEQGLLADLKTQEQLCIEKYGDYANQACDTELRDLFCSLKQNEQKHLNWICEIQGGTVPNTGTSQSGCNSNCNCGCKQNDNCRDAYLCKDALSMEKHVSSLYDVSVFEFSDSQLRDVLNTIQTEEQHHGKQIYDYMSSHNIYA